MEGYKLDMMAPKEAQLKILVSYLEKLVKGGEKELPVTTRTMVLVDRYLWGWTEDLYNKEGLTPKGAFLYYKAIIK